MDNPCKACGLHEELPQSDAKLGGIPVYVCSTVPLDKVYVMKEVYINE